MLLAFAVVVSGGLTLWQIDGTKVQAGSGGAEPPPLASGSPDTPDGADGGSGAIRLAPTYRFKDIESISVTSTDAEYLAKFSTEEQASILGFYNEFGSGVPGPGRYVFNGIFSFHNDAQLRWMVDNGYPLPEEILAAQRMSDDELGDMADNGNFKAGLFYLHRRVELIRAKRDLGLDQDPSLSRASENASDLQLELRLLTSGSPFAAYAVAARAAAQGNTAKAVASYQLASTLGDTRSDEFFGAVFNALNPNVRASEAVANYDGLVREAFASNSGLNYRRVRARKPFPEM